MFRRIQIQNYRSCKDTTIELEETICALVGRNGAGKTTILKGIERMCRTAVGLGSAYVGARRHQHAPRGRAFSAEIQLGNDTYRYELSTLFDGVPTFGLLEQLDLMGEHGPEPVFVREAESVRLPDRPDPLRIPAHTPAITALRLLLPPESPVMRRVEAVAKFLELVSYDTFGSSEPEVDSIWESEYVRWKTSFLQGEVFAGPLLYELIFLKRELPETWTELATLLGRDGLGLVYGFELSSTEIKGDAIDPSNNPGGQDVLHFPRFFVGESLGGQGVPLRFDDLSLGTRRIIQILTRFFFETKSVLLLEHPEDSIHPGLLRKLVEILRVYSERTQLIFTTHSPEVLDILRPEEVVLVTAESGNTVAKRLPAPEVARAKELLKNEGSLSQFLGYVGAP